MQHLSDGATTALGELLQDAELDAEQAIGWVRIAVALTLGFAALAAAPWIAADETAESATRLRLAGLTVAFLLALGAASVLGARVRFCPTWLAYAFVTADAVIVSVNVWATLHTRQLSGDWVAALPAILAAPLLLSVGALRFRALVQVWATTCFAAGLATAAAVRGIGATPSHAAANMSGAAVVPFFTPPANAMRMVILILVGATTVYIIIRAHRLLVRASAEAMHRANLARFLPHDVAPLVMPGADAIWRRGRRQQVTILFVDLRGSTQIAEGMNPAQLSVFVSAFRRRITRATKETAGVIDKFIGDGALLVFGVPEPRSNDSERAVRCGREILRLVEIWNKKRGFDPPVRVGIGMHAGEAYCGIVGDEQRLEFTVLGDTVNVAARIEQATKKFNESLLISEAVLEGVGSPMDWQEIAREPLRGRIHPIGIFAPRETPERDRTSPLNTGAAISKPDHVGKGEAEGQI